MNTQKYDVEVRVHLSLGKTKKVRVDAVNTADALLKATTALDKQGITHWDLVTVAPVLN